MLSRSSGLSTDYSSLGSPRPPPPPPPPPHHLSFRHHQERQRGLCPNAIPVCNAMPSFPAELRSAKKKNAAEILHAYVPKCSICPMPQRPNGQKEMRWLCLSIHGQNSVQNNQPKLPSHVINSSSCANGVRNAPRSNSQYQAPCRASPRTPASLPLSPSARSPP